MARTILVYGTAMAALTAILQFFQYRYIIRDLTLEIYLGLVAIFFAILGVWAGIKFSTRKKEIPEKISADPAEILQQSGLSKREYEVLILISQGLSNQEIAEKLFVSLNTVKTHSSNLFSKLEVKRRTQAIQKAKELGIIS